MNKKAPKIKKLDSVPKINRRLFKLWSEAVSERAGHKCEFCGCEKGEDNGHGSINKLDSHHLISRKIKDSPLKFDIRNGVLADPFHHKFGIPSFHKDPITTITWFMKKRSDDYAFLVDNVTFTVDLENRNVLEEIEKKLIEKKPLNLPLLKEIETQFPKKPKIPRKPKQPTTKGNLFEEDEESSSSSD